MLFQCDKNPQCRFSNGRKGGGLPLKAVHIRLRREATCTTLTDRMLEDLDIPKYWTLAYLKLKFWDVTTWFQVEMTNSALRNKRAMDRLLRRITLLLHNAS